MDDSFSCLIAPSLVKMWTVDKVTRGTEIEHLKVAREESIRALLSTLRMLDLRSLSTFNPRCCFLTIKLSEARKVRSA